MESRCGVEGCLGDAAHAVTVLLRLPKEGRGPYYRKVGEDFVEVDGVVRAEVDVCVRHSVLH